MTLGKISDFLRQIAELVDQCAELRCCTDFRHGVGGFVFQHFPFCHLRIQTRLYLTIHAAFGSRTLRQLDLAAQLAHVVRQLLSLTDVLKTKQVFENAGLLILGHFGDGVHYGLDRAIRIACHLLLNCGCVQPQVGKRILEFFCAFFRRRELGNDGLHRRACRLLSLPQRQQRGGVGGGIRCADLIGLTAHAFHDTDDVAALGQCLVIQIVDGVTQALNARGRDFVELGNFGQIVTELLDRQIKRHRSGGSGFCHRHNVFFTLNAVPRGGGGELGNFVRGHGQSLGHDLNLFAHVVVSLRIFAIGIARPIDLSCHAEHGVLELRVRLDGFANRGERGHAGGDVGRAIALQFVTHGDDAIKALFSLGGGLYGQLVTFERCAVLLDGFLCCGL